MPPKKSDGRSSYLKTLHEQAHRIQASNHGMEYKTALSQAAAVLRGGAAAAPKRVPKTKRDPAGKAFVKAQKAAGKTGVKVVGTVRQVLTGKAHHTSAGKTKSQLEPHYSVQTKQLVVAEGPRAGSRRTIYSIKRKATGASAAKLAVFQLPKGIGKAMALLPGKTVSGILKEAIYQNAPAAYEAMLTAEQRKTDAFIGKMSARYYGTDEGSAAAGEPYSKRKRLAE